MARIEIRIVHGLSPEQAAELCTHITAHAEAQVALSWAGGGDPVDVPLIEAEAEVAKLRLEGFIRQLQEKAS